MFEYLKFSIGSMKSGYKSIVLRLENRTIEYEILHAGLLDVPKGKYQAHPADNWFEDWEALNVSSWDVVYSSPDSHAGEAWRLTVQENGATYKSGGDSCYPRQGLQFLEWLDVVMPEMEFISPKRLEQVIFRYQNVHDDRIDHERLEINRAEQKVLLEKWRDVKNEEPLPRHLVRSSHSYDFSNAREYLYGLLALCQQDLDPAEFEEPGIFTSGSDTSNPLTRIFVKMHDGSTLNGYVGAGYVPRWPEFLGGVHQYFADLGSTLVEEAQKTLYQQALQGSGGKYIYCKVRFENSYRLYSYRTEDDTLQVGDMVDVPVGKENTVICGRIEKKEYFDEAHVPYPVNKTKLIIGKHEGKDEY